MAAGCFPAAPPYSMTPQPLYAYPLLSAMMISMILVQLHHRLGAPGLAIVNRWLRWLIFAFGAAYISVDLELIDRPIFVLVAAFLLLWFLGETLYNWMAIHALSVSQLPLFPRYTVNQSGEEWPIQTRFLKVRDWLRGHGFRQIQSLKAEVGSGFYLRVSVYQDEPAQIRVQVTFLPQPNGTLTMCYAVTSRSADGYRYLTDNLYIPFGGFYPETWLVERSPWRRSLPRLLARHQERLKRSGATLEAWTTDPVGDLNAEQGQLDRLNTEMGFLHPQQDREELGKITSPGRYRVWKEIWMLDYFGRAARYE
ncbi:MAG: hypothetical protein RL324_1057 [Verrucomicrobiota bacterium]